MQIAYERQLWGRWRQIQTGFGFGPSCELKQEQNSDEKGKRKIEGGRGHSFHLHKRPLFESHFLF